MKSTSDDGCFHYPPLESDLHKIVLSSHEPDIKYTDLVPIGKGGKGLAYTAIQHGGERSGVKVVIKIPNLNTKDYSEEEIRVRIRELNEAVSSEYESSKDLRSLPGVAPIINFGIARWTIQHEYAFEALLIFAVFPFITGRNLDTWCDENRKREGSFKGLADATEWFRFARQILSILRNVHNQRIIHGDIWPPNIMIDEGENLTVIDFGECWKFDTTLDRLADTSSAKRHAYLAPERLRSDLNPRQRWYSPADIYSIGGVLYYLATGQQPPSPFQPEGLRKNREVKQEILDTLLDTNPLLYLTAPGVADIISICLHPKAEDRVSHISPILDTIDLFTPPVDGLNGINAVPSLTDITHELVSLMRVVRGLRSSPAAVHPIFRRLTHHRIQQLRDEVASLNSNLFILEGDRDTHINGMLTCLDCLKKGDEIRAVTSTQFWKPGNFGPYGRLLTKLLCVADRGVRISWTLLVNDVPTPIDREVILYQQRAVTDHCSVRKIALNDFVGKDAPFFIGYCLLPSQVIDAIRKARNAFILLREEGHWLLVTPDYRIGDYGEPGKTIAVETTMTSVRIWAGARRTQGLIDKHREYLAKAESILTWKA